jgi:signal transduction histidine kinase
MALIFIIASELSLQIKKENIAFIFSILMAIIALAVDYYNNDFNSQLFLVIISVAIINNFSNKIGKYFAAIILLGYFSMGFLRPVLQQEIFVFEDIISVVYLNVMLYGLIIISFYMLKKQFFTNRHLTRTLRLIEKQNEVIESLTATQERNKIAKEIHDTVGHRLTGALMLIEHSLRIDEPQERNQKLVKSRDLIKEALNDIRQSVKLIAHDSNTSFQEKVQELIDKIQSTMNMEIEIINEVESLTSIHEHLLLRAIMECSTNTVKHSSANKASILIQKSNQTLFFTYTDNGVNEEQFEFGFGLKSMKQSVVGVGGVFHVYASHDGFTVSIKLPHYENNQGGEHE